MKRKIAALFIALFAAIAFSQPQTGGFGTGGNAGRLGPSFSSLAFFEFAPASGQGMTAACACANPAGAKGEALTFTRTGSATCSKQGLATTGIVNGDLVVCAADQARVEPSGGVLGLRVEGARTNSVLRSQELDNAAWVNNVSSAPFNTTVTANAATAPDGTATADRLDVIATTGAEFSSRAQVAGCPVTAQGISVYVRGVSGSGTIDLCNNSTCTACAYVDTSWSRCVGTAAVVGLGQYALGNFTVATGVDRPTQSVYVWGMDCEAGAYATSYIPTVAAAVTRNAESATMTVPAGLSQSVGCSAATLSTAWSSSVSVVWRALLFDSNGRAIYSNASTTAGIFDGTNDIQRATTFTAGGTKRIVTTWGAGALTVNDGSGTTSGAFTGTFGAGALTSLSLGQQGGSSHLDGIITRVQSDANSGNCR